MSSKNPRLSTKLPKSAGGWASILYTFKEARRVGGFLRMWRALRSKNACKTCALGMGGQQGGMTNEEGKFPEFCKKSVQAMAADMAGAIRRFPGAKRSSAWRARCARRRRTKAISI
jgi:hypothetical protein